MLNTNGNRLRDQRHAWNSTTSALPVAMTILLSCIGVPAQQTPTTNYPVEPKPQTATVPFKP